MIIYRTDFQPESVIHKLKRKDWERSMKNITDGEILSINENPLSEKKELSEKVENDVGEQPKQEQV